MGEVNVDLFLFTNPISRGRIARWMLEEIGQPYRVKIIEFGRPMKSFRYLRTNPMGKVPCLHHGEYVVTETPAICAYLAETFPEVELAPTPEERADYYRWLFFGAGPVEAAITNKTMGFEVPESMEMTTGYGTYDIVCDVLEGHLKGSRYIAGHRFTAADVYVGSQIGWGLDWGTIPDRPAFRDYAARVQNRDAYRRATDLDDALIPKESG